MSSGERTGAAAGWYRDPEQPSQLRYWDGQRWTEHRHHPMLRPAPEAENRPGWFRRHKVLTATGAALAVLAVGGALGSEPSSPRADAPTAAASPSQSPTAAPSSSAAAKPTQTPAQRLEEAVRAALGKCNRPGVPRIHRLNYEARTLDVGFALNENLTDDLTRLSARKDLVSILRATQESKVPVRLVRIVGTYSMVDQLGRASEDQVIRVAYRGSTVRQIDFANFDSSNVYKVATLAVVHPEFGP